MTGDFFFVLLPELLCMALVSSLFFGFELPSLFSFVLCFFSFESIVLPWGDDGAGISRYMLSRKMGYGGDL